MTEKKLRGTAAMDPETRKEVCRKGGLAISRDRAHMANLGRLGGNAISQDKTHMAEIGRRGGSSGKGKKKPRKPEAPTEDCP